MKGSGHKSRVGEWLEMGGGWNKYKVDRSRKRTAAKGVPPRQCEEKKEEEEEKKEEEK